MKQTMILWMFTAVMICGVTLAITSCGKDEKTALKGQQPEGNVDPDSEANIASKEQQPEENDAVDPVAGAVFFGTIGGDSNCILVMPDGSEAGYYSFLNYTRDARFVSYNANTHTLVINVYEHKENTNRERNQNSSRGEFQGIPIQKNKQEKALQQSRTTGQYIGKFVGTFTSNGRGLHRYKGVFTNYKGGKVNFDLQEQAHK